MNLEKRDENQAFIPGGIQHILHFKCQGVPCYRVYHTTEIVPAGRPAGGCLAEAE